MQKRNIFIKSKDLVKFIYAAPSLYLLLQYEDQIHKNRTF